MTTQLKRIGLIELTNFQNDRSYDVTVSDIYSDSEKTNRIARVIVAEPWGTSCMYSHLKQVNFKVNTLKISVENISDIACVLKLIKCDHLDLYYYGVENLERKLAVIPQCYKSMTIRLWFKKLPVGISSIPQIRNLETLSIFDYEKHKNLHNASSIDEEKLRSVTMDYIREEIPKAAMISLSTNQFVCIPKIFKEFKYKHLGRRCPINDEKSILSLGKIEFGTQYVLIIDDRAQRASGKFSLYVAVVEWCQMLPKAKYYGILTKNELPMWNRLPVELQNQIVENLDVRTRLVDPRNFMYNVERRAKIKIDRLDFEEEIEEASNERLIRIKIWIASELSNKPFNLLDYFDNREQFGKFATRINHPQPNYRYQGTIVKLAIIANTKILADVAVILERLLAKANWNVFHVFLSVVIRANLGDFTGEGPPIFQMNTAYLKSIIERINMRSFSARFIDIPDLMSTLRMVPANLSALYLEMHNHLRSADLTEDVLAMPQVKNAEKVFLMNYARLSVETFFAWKAKTIDIYTDELKERDILKFLMKIANGNYRETGVFLSLESEIELDVRRILTRFEFLELGNDPGEICPMITKTPENEHLKTHLNIYQPRPNRKIAFRFLFTMAFVDFSADRRHQHHYFAISATK
ncbi:unnamed protein product [Caenorhabditis bovis]|uniref:DUF38 domain-containing protein n=1 Tax=Caenorhabditis bovis TaxID=2654633 RepID=A0A8S1EWR3_9PELO|nr:unnamed protein product [Caenorhabditis bovis]